MALRIQQIAGGGLHSLVLLSDGSIWATGDNGSGQLGDGIYGDRFEWVPVMATGSGVTQIAAGGMHSLALKSDGSVWATGLNDDGQLGDGTTETIIAWTCVLPAGSNVIQVDAGDAYSLVLKSDGSVWATGYNALGQLGDGTKINKSTWTSVIPEGSGVIQLAAGHGHSLALKSDGSLWATGRNKSGQLGDATEMDKAEWVSVMPSGSGVVQVAAGYGHSLALKNDGAVWAAGANECGQLGHGTKTNKKSWVSVIPSGVTQLAAGDGHSLVLKSDGALCAAGYNNSGQLGDGNFDDRLTWISVMACGVAQVIAGDSHSFVLKSDGLLWKAGNNSSGQLSNEEEDCPVWMPDHFFEKLLLESLLDESKSESESGAITDPVDDWRGLSL